MIVYYSMIAWMLSLGLVSNISYKIEIQDGQYIKRIGKVFAFLGIAYIIYFVGCRSGIGDTPAYISMFNDYPDNISNLILDNYSKDKGFVILSVLFKQFISADYHVWLFTIACISGIYIAKTIYKYSENYFFSLYLFIVTVQFVWMLNGIRQFLVVSILFANVDLILEKKYIKFFSLVFFLSTIHITALIMIPVYFFVQTKPMTRQNLILLGIIIIVALSMDNISDYASQSLENTAYSGYLENAATSYGSNIIRTLVALVPCFLAYYGRGKVKEANSKIINICINMSILTAIMYFSSSISGAILIGRLPIYCDLYNLILIPWLLNNIFDKNERRLVYYIVIICYFIFFYYKAIIAMGLYYISDILNLKL